MKPQEPCNVTLIANNILVESGGMCDYINYHVFMLVFCGIISVGLLLVAGVLLLCCSERLDSRLVENCLKWSFIVSIHSLGFEGALLCLYLTVALACGLQFMHILWSSSRRNAVVSVSTQEPPPTIVTINTQVNSDEVCSICLESTDDQWISLKVCGHVFHKACIAKWRQSTCPLCRVNFKNVVTVQQA